MTRRRVRAALLATAATAALSLAGCASAPLDAHAQLRELSGLMQGSFSSAQQAAQDKRFLDIRLRVIQIWPSAEASTQWLYVEQATASAVDKPYRQRVYALTRSADGMGYVSKVYLLPGKALDFAGANAQRFDSLKPEALELRAGCEVYLARSVTGAASYSGGTRGKLCASELRGASYAISGVRLDAQGMLSWDRGFDAQDQQVWGSASGGYRFTRVP